MSEKPKSKTDSAKEFFKSVMRLAKAMKRDPRGIDIDMNRKGEEILGVFQDTHYHPQFQDLRIQKINAIEIAARDISEGGMTLQSSSIGISHLDGKLVQFITPHGTPPAGRVVFSVTYRSSKVIDDLGAQETVDVSQDDINTSLYRLAVILSEVI